MNLSNLDIVALCVALVFFAVAWLIWCMVKSAPRIEQQHEEPSEWGKLERAGKQRANEHNWSNR